MDLDLAPLITLIEPCRASRSPLSGDSSRHRWRGRVKNVGLRHRQPCFVIDLEAVDLAIQHRNLLNHSSCLYRYRNQSLLDLRQLIHGEMAAEVELNPTNLHMPYFQI